MGKKSKRQRGTANAASNRREAIQARRQPKDPRTKANELRQEFVRLSHYKFSPQGRRVIALENYFNLITEKMQQNSSNAVNFVTKDDLSFLMGIYRNTQEVPLFRAGALAMWGEISAHNCEERDACLCMQFAIKICNQNIEAEPYIASLQERCLGHLDRWRNTNAIKFSNGTRRSLFAGDQCDSCGKLVQEYGVDFMACCGRCKLSYYCSVECQKTDWKLPGRGHKGRCRKKGEFLVGDTALCADPDGPIPFALSIQILAPIDSNGTGDGKPDKWLVSNFPECDNFGVVLAQNLTQVRPVNWWSFKEHWKKKRALKEMMELVAADGYGCSTSTV